MPALHAVDLRSVPRTTYAPLLSPNLLNPPFPDPPPPRVIPEHKNQFYALKKYWFWLLKKSR